MIFLEEHGRWLQVLHAILGGATVAVTTHLAVWVARKRHKGARWFAAVGLGVYAAQFLLGNLIYPAYKVRVRAEYLDVGSAVMAEAKVRQQARTRVADQLDLPTSRVRVDPDLTHVARVFDIKEHWAALGLALALGACVLAWRWRPRQDGEEARPLLIGLAVGSAACSWVAAVVGLWVSTFRSLG